MEEHILYELIPCINKALRIYVCKPRNSKENVGITVKMSRILIVFEEAVNCIFKIKVVF